MNDSNATFDNFLGQPDPLNAASKISTARLASESRLYEFAKRMEFKFLGVPAHFLQTTGYISYKRCMDLLKNPLGEENANCTRRDQGDGSLSAEMQTGFCQAP